MKDLGLHSLMGEALPRSSSEEWRTREAMDIFDLLRNEYKNSKKLNVLKRYKELERIIGMFTSEPVLAKLLWLSTESLRAAESVADSHGDEDIDKYNGGRRQSLDVHDKDRNSQKKVLEWLQNITFRFKSWVPIVSKLTPGTTGVALDSDVVSEFSCDRHCVTSPKSSCALENYISPPMSCVSTPGGPRLSSDSYNTNTCNTSSSNSDIFTFNGGSSSSLETTYCKMSSFRRPSSEINANHLYSINKCNSDASTERKPMVKRRGIETCVIRRDDIPAFQIPRQHCATTQTFQLIPALYKKNDVPTQKPSRHYRRRALHSRFHISMSTPNIVQLPLIGFGRKIKGMLFHDKRQGERYCSESSIQQNHTGFFNDNDVLSNSFGKKNSAPAANCSISFTQSLETREISNIVKAYENLIQMKREFIELNQSNNDIVTRYRKMKSIIKSCITLFEY